MIICLVVGFVIGFCAMYATLPKELKEFAVEHRMNADHIVDLVAEKTGVTLSYQGIGKFTLFSFSVNGETFTAAVHIDELEHCVESLVNRIEVARKYKV